MKLLGEKLTETGGEETQMTEVRTEGLGGPGRREA